MTFHDLAIVLLYAAGEWLRWVEVFVISSSVPQFCSGLQWVNASCLSHSLFCARILPVCSRNLPFLYFPIDDSMGVPIFTQGSSILRRFGDGGPHIWGVPICDNGTITFQIDSCTRGYHAYCTIWTPTLSEHISCKREIANVEDPYAVAVMLRNTFVVQLVQIDWLID